MKFLLKTGFKKGIEYRKSNYYSHGIVDVIIQEKKVVAFLNKYEMLTLFFEKLQMEKDVMILTGIENSERKNKFYRQQWFLFHINF